MRNWVSRHTGATRRAARTILRLTTRLRSCASCWIPADDDLDDQSLLDSFQSATSEDRVYVLTPQGQVVDLTAGSSVLDFAYHVHTEVGHRCRGAKVNGRIVPLHTW